MSSNFNTETALLTMPDSKIHQLSLIKGPDDKLYLRAAGLPEGLSIENSSVRDIRIATAISKVDGDNGKLSYRGYDINDLVNNTSYEEVAYMLLRGDLPNQDQLSQFKSDLAKAAVIKPELQSQLIGALRAIRIDEKTNPMALMSTLVSIMDANEPLPVGKQEARYASTLRTMAVMPSLIGLVNARMQAGKESGRLDHFAFALAEDFGPNGKNFSYAGLLLSMLQQGKLHAEGASRVDGIRAAFQSPDQLDPAQVKAIDQYLILHAEHGNNLSSFTARVVDSGEAKEGAWRITLGAMQSLAGNRHGNASNDALNNLKHILARDEGTIKEKVAAYLAESDANYAVSKKPGAQLDPSKFTIEGIGHKIYHKPDPRAGALQKILADNKNSLKDSHLLEVALELQEQLKTHTRFGAKKDKPLFPNVDFCSGVLLTQYLGIDERLMTSMFAVGRNVGWQAHAAEHARDAKNIVRPEAVVLTPDRTFLPMKSRTPTTQVSAAATAPVFPKANLEFAFAKAA